MIITFPCLRNSRSFNFNLFLPAVCVQANSNEIVLASTHDVQEVDVSTLVAVQPFTWIGDDFDKESRRYDSQQNAEKVLEL